MDRKTLIAGLAIVGAIISSGYIYLDTKDRLSSIQTRVDRLTVERDAASANVVALERRLAAIEDGSRKMSDQLREVDQRALPSRIAAAVLDTAKGDLVAQIAAKLASTREYADALRGKEGEPADPRQVAEQLSVEEFSIQVAQALWISRREQLLATPELLAGVAGAVHEKYGAQLKGTPAQTPSADVIARLLAQDLAFAQLVGEMLPRR